MKKLIFVFALVFSVIPCQARIITVDDNGPAEFTNIQAAINDANNGDVVEVQPGTYTGPGNRDIDFKGKAITVCSTNPNDPNIVAGTIINCNGSWWDRHRGFYFHSGETTGSALNGFTITGGYVFDCGASEGGGAGICIYNSSLAISNCIITDNHTELIPACLGFCFGGGIKICGNSSPTLTNCIISGNSLGDFGRGGGIYISPGSNPLISNCIISDNSTGGRGLGGGIYCSQITIHSSIISNNTASGHEGMGGGIYCNGSSVLTVVNCTIVDNWAAQDGGGIYFYTYESPIRTITNSIIWGNSPDQIYAYDSTKILATYSDISGGWPGGGNINTDPCFTDSCNGDYHLKSQTGRWNPSSQTWVKDAVTSPCIDAGDPNSDWTSELWPNGKRINMGAYGGTPEASMSLSNVGNIADLNNDDFVDCNDMRLFTEKWLNNLVLLPEDLDRNGFVDLADFAILADNWLWP
jgi:parallel beta-helix repeat protein